VAEPGEKKMLDYGERDWQCRALSGLTLNPFLNLNRQRRRIKKKIKITIEKRFDGRPLR
jgi:hypothetical protein